MTPPRAPRRFSWAIAGRVAGRVFAGFMLVWLVALVAWPEKHVIDYNQISVVKSGMFVPMPRNGERRPLQPPPLTRNASLSLLPDLLGM